MITLNRKLTCQNWLSEGAYIYREAQERENSWLCRVLAPLSLSINIYFRGTLQRPKVTGVL